MDAVSSGLNYIPPLTTPALQRSDRQAALNAQYPNGIRIFGVVEAAQERVFGKLDGDGDGGVTAEELKGLAGVGGGKNDPAAFAALDSDGDGKLSFRELQASKLFSPSTLGELLGAQSGQGLAGWLVSEGDSDGDGALSAAELRAIGPKGEFKPRILADGTPSQDPLDQILGKADRAFAAADADGNGQITAEELATIMNGYAHRPQALNREAMPKVLLTGDLDGSGGLSKAELADQASPTQDVDGLYSALDADGDGEISAAELKMGVSVASAYSNRPVTPGEARLDPPAEFALLRLYSQVASRLVAEMTATARSRTEIDI